MLYLVTQKPRAKHSSTFKTGYAIVEATTKAAAIRRAIEFHGEYISTGDKDRDFLKPEAQELREGIRGYI